MVIQGTETVECEILNLLAISFIVMTLSICIVVLRELDKKSNVTGCVVFRNASMPVRQSAINECP